MRYLLSVVAASVVALSPIGTAGAQSRGTQPTSHPGLASVATSVAYCLRDRHGSGIDMTAEGDGYRLGFFVSGDPSFFPNGQSFRPLVGFASLQFTLEREQPAEEAHVAWSNTWDNHREAFFVARHHGQLWHDTVAITDRCLGGALGAL